MPEFGKAKCWMKKGRSKNKSTEARDNCTDGLHFVIWTARRENVIPIVCPCISYYVYASAMWETLPQFYIVCTIHKCKCVFLLLDNWETIAQSVFVFFILALAVPRIPIPFLVTRLPYLMSLPNFMSVNNGLPICTTGEVSKNSARKHSLHTAYSKIWPIC